MADPQLLYSYSHKDDCIIGAIEADIDRIERVLSKLSIYRPENLIAFAPKGHIKSNHLNRYLQYKYYLLPFQSVISEKLFRFERTTRLPSELKDIVTEIRLHNPDAIKKEEGIEALEKECIVPDSNKHINKKLRNDMIAYNKTHDSDTDYSYTYSVFYPPSTTCIADASKYDKCYHRISRQLQGEIEYLKSQAKIKKCICIELSEFEAAGGIIFEEHSKYIKEQLKRSHHSISSNTSNSSNSTVKFSITLPAGRFLTDQCSILPTTECFIHVNTCVYLNKNH